MLGTNEDSRARDLVPRTGRGSISHWFAQLERDGVPLAPRRALDRSLTADVCIVGAGYTGLWTAYSLLLADPSLRVVVLEAEIAGYGASGRNGGAVIAQFNGSRAYWSKRAGRRAVIEMERAVVVAVDHVGDVVRRERIPCSYSKNGVLMVARTPLEAQRLRTSVEEDRAWGFGADHSSYLERDALLTRIRVEDALGARFSPNCASIHPGHLVRGLAEAVERLGGAIFESTRVVRIDPGVARTDRGHEAHARYVVRATEAYTESLETDRRVMIPVHTSMLVTEPIPGDLLAQIGWQGREALLAEHPFLHLQHTADRRITIGGDDNRVPYRYGSAPCPDAAAPRSVFAMYRAELHRLFPALRDVPVEHSWQGIFAAPRNWAPGVDVDRRTGLAWAGGYVGEGVAMANLAGRTLADLLLERDTTLTRLPFVGPAARSWEPEPLRYIGSVIIAAMRRRADRVERRTDRPSRLMQLANRAAGYTGHVG